MADQQPSHPHGADRVPTWSEIRAEIKLMREHWVSMAARHPKREAGWLRALAGLADPFFWAAMAGALYGCAVGRATLPIFVLLSLAIPIVAIVCWVIRQERAGWPDSQ
jgi:hypothetical protein